MAWCSLKLCGWTLWDLLFLQLLRRVRNVLLIAPWLNVKTWVSLAVARGRLEITRTVLRYVGSLLGKMLIAKLMHRGCVLLIFSIVVPVDLVADLALVTRLAVPAALTCLAISCCFHVKLFLETPMLSTALLMLGIYSRRSLVNGLLRRHRSIFRPKNMSMVTN